MWWKFHNNQKEKNWTIFAITLKSFIAKRCCLVLWNCWSNLICFGWQTTFLFWIYARLDWFNQESRSASNWTKRIGIFLLENNLAMKTMLSCSQSITCVTITLYLYTSGLGCRLWRTGNFNKAHGPLFYIYLILRTTIAAIFKYLKTVPRSDPGYCL